MSAPILLDLFCKAGGAGKGYADAGFEVVGIDRDPQPRYPFEFIRADVFEFLRWWRLLGRRQRPFDAIHASPPCQAFSSMRTRWSDREHPELIGPVRARLRASGLPFVIENVEGAPLHAPTTLCGSMFGLEVRRHRLFECSLPVTQPDCDHVGQGPVVGVYGNTGAGGNRGLERRRGRTNGVADWRRAMGIDWMTAAELTQAIPPVYTEYIGRQLITTISDKGLAA